MERELDENAVDNIVAFTAPYDADMFLFSICADPDAVAGGEADMKKCLPPDWKGKYVGHFYKLDADDPDNISSGFTQDFIEANQLTHLALLEGNANNRNAPYYFGGETIMRNGVLLWYSEPRQKFYFIHCKHCARSIAQWMTHYQATWQKNALPATPATVN